MIDLGISKLALIGTVALIVIGPEKLPRVARTVGTLLGKAQRYVNDVKAEVSRSMEMDELRKMKDSVESAARDVEQSFERTASTVRDDLEGVAGSESDFTSSTDPEAESDRSWFSPRPAVYTPPRKNWRVKRGAMPRWYKLQNGVRTHVQSGAARVARHRPKKRF